MGVFDVKKNYDTDIINIYQSAFDFESYEIQDKETVSQITERENLIRQNVLKNINSRKEIAKNLYEIQQIMANHKNGVFVKYLEYLSISKSNAYRLLDMWELYQNTEKDKVFDLPHSLVNKLKKEDIETKQQIEILESENPNEVFNNIKNVDQNTNFSKEQKIEEIDIKIEKLENKIRKLQSQRDKILNEE